MYLYDSIKENTHEATRWGKLVTIKSKQTLHHFKCNHCNVEFTKAKNGKRGQSDVHFCTTCFTPELAQKETIKCRDKKAEIRGEKFDRGYKEIFVGKDYPYRSTKWVREHIVNMETHIGNKIPTGMVVHHIDGSKTNNEIDNLLLCSVSDHNNCHAKIERLVFELYKQGLVGFDSNNLEYYFKG